MSRPTEDVDLFTDTDDGVREAVSTREMVEFEVSAGDCAVRLQLVRFDRNLSPVLMEIGPVLHVEDVVGSKVVAMVTRAEPRDFIDVAAAQSRYTLAQLRALGLRTDPSLTDEEFADAIRRLDRLDDSIFADLYGQSQDQIAELRTRFESWPRS